MGFTTSTKSKRSPSTAIDRLHKFRAGVRDCKYGAPENLARRRRYERDTAQWLKYYLGAAFPLPWAEIHRRYIADLDYIADNGGWKAQALPRGSGKTTIAEGFALKCMLTGKSRFLVLLAAKATAAKSMADDIKSWLLCNDRLMADYPEVCAPIRHTKGIPQAMATVTVNGGTPVRMKWTAGEIILPDCPMVMPGGDIVPAVSAGAIIRCEGITGALRGMKHTAPDGSMIRPDLAIPDDPQTPESARSPEQSRQRLSIIRADVGGLAGPGKDIRIIVPCTIIEPGDLADEITDPERTPDFLGERQPFFLSMPENMEWWDEYNEHRKEGLALRDGGKMALQFYKQHREQLIEGAEVSWIARRGDCAIDGIQWGMDQYYKLGSRAFATELQNQPLPREEMINLGKVHVERCEGNRPRWTCPDDTIEVYAFIDLNPRTSGLHWAVVSFAEQMTGHIVAYGNYPGKFAPLVPEGASDAQEDALLFEGLRTLCAELSKAEVKTESGTPMRIEMCGIDGGYNFATVVRFVRAARMPFQLATDRGRASTKYLDAGRDVVKAMTHVHLRKNAKNERYLSHNSDAIREIVHRAFMAGPDAPGGIEIHKSPPAHDEFVESILSQRLTDKAEGARGIMYRWSMVPGGQDHWLDCVVGCYALAHWRGIETAGQISARRVKKRRRGVKVRGSKI